MTTIAFTSTEEVMKILEKAHELTGITKSEFIRRACKEKALKDNIKVA